MTDITGLSVRGKLYESDERARSAYQKRIRNAYDDPAKQRQREMVLEFIRAFHPTEHPPRLLSLPGRWWMFEKMVQHEWPEAIFTGLEWSWAIIEQGKINMPGFKLVRFDRPLKTYDSSLIGYQTDKALWIECHAGTLLGGMASEVRSLNDRARKRWFREFKNNTAVWLDFTSPFCAETKHAIKGLSHYVFCRGAPVPVAITVQLGRDNIPLKDGLNPLDRRMNTISHWVSSRNKFCKWVSVNAVKYTSGSGVAMATFMGLVEWDHDESDG